MSVQSGVLGKFLITEVSVTPAVVQLNLVASKEKTSSVLLFVFYIKAGRVPGCLATSVSVSTSVCCIVILFLHPRWRYTSVLSLVSFGRAGQCRL